VISGCLIAFPLSQKRPKTAFEQLPFFSLQVVSLWEVFGNYRLKRIFRPGTLLEMSDTKASKDWAPFSKQIKLDESDWAVVDALFEDYRNREGVISKADFIRKLLLTGARSQLLYLRQHSPASLSRVAKTSGTN
jgi:hypothetical protein